MLDLAQIAANEQLQNLSQDTRLLVLHPNYNQQHRLLFPFLEEEGAAYVRFVGESLTRDDLTQQVTDALFTQNEGKWFEGVKRLVLDECDRAHPAHFETFLNEVVDQIDGHVMIVSRCVPEYIYSSPKLRSQSCFIPTEPRVMLTDYAAPRPDEKATLVEVRALGSGHVMVNGRAIVDWDGTLPRALFFYLIDRGMTTRSQIFETFWPNLSQKEATNVFHVTKRKISEVLGIDLTVYWSGFYRISPAIQLDYDVSHFSDMIQRSDAAVSSHAIELLSACLMLYRNDFLTTMDMVWTLARRHELRQSYGETAAALARLAEEAGHREEALGLYIRALATHPQREDLARHIMRLYAESGKYAEAEATYKRLELELDKVVNIEPAPETRALITSIRAAASASV